MFFFNCVHVDVLSHKTTPLFSVENHCLCLFPDKVPVFVSFLDCASPVCSWPTWFSPDCRNLPIWCLLATVVRVGGPTVSPDQDRKGPHSMKLHICIPSRLSQSINGFQSKGFGRSAGPGVFG